MLVANGKEGDFSIFRNNDKIIKNDKTKSISLLFSNHFVKLTNFRDHLESVELLSVYQQLEASCYAHSRLLPLPARPSSPILKCHHSSINKID